MVKINILNFINFSVQIINFLCCRCWNYLSCIWRRITCNRSFIGKCACQRFCCSAAGFFISVCPLTVIIRYVYKYGTSPLCMQLAYSCAVPVLSWFCILIIVLLSFLIISVLIISAEIVTAVGRRRNRRHRLTKCCCNGICSACSAFFIQRNIECIERELSVVSQIIQSHCNVHRIFSIACSA